MQLPHPEYRPLASQAPYTLIGTRNVLGLKDSNSQRTILLSHAAGLDHVL